MKEEELKKFHKDIFELYNAIKELSANPDSKPETINYLTKFIVLQMSGYIDKYIIYLISEFCDRKLETEEAKKFISSHTEKLTNMKSENIKSLFKKFNANWIKNINERQWISLDEIVKTRHNVAHCKDTDIRLADYMDHFEKTVHTLKIIKNNMI